MKQTYIVESLVGDPLNEKCYRLTTEIIAEKIKYVDSLIEFYEGELLVGVFKTEELLNIQLKRGKL